MEAIWNRKELEHPPNATCYVERQKFDTTTFLATMKKIIKDLDSQELLHTEAAILSRVIYRIKGKFRNDKGVKSMCKVNKALLIYLSLSLEKEYENLINYVESDRKYIKLPSKQMVQYVLVRTQGFAKLMSRVEEVSRESAHFLKSRIALGHAWCVSIVAYSVVSRIWLLSRHITKQSCTWYNDLYHYLKFFKATGVNWLPDDYDLTNNLESWLALPWINEPVTNVPSSHELKSTMFKLITPRNYDSDEDFELDVQDHSTDTKVANPLSYRKKDNIVHDVVPMESNKIAISTDDTGEYLDRRTFELNQSRRQSNTFIDNESVPVVKQKKCKENISKEEDSSTINKKRQTSFQNLMHEGTNMKCDNNFVKIPKKLTKKKHSSESLTIENVNNESDLSALLNRESYPGLDKLQWNMIRNKSKKLLNKLNDKCPDGKKQTVSFKKVSKRIQRWLIP